MDPEEIAAAEAAQAAAAQAEVDRVASEAAAAQQEADIEARAQARADEIDRDRQTQAAAAQQRASAGTVLDPYAQAESELEAQGFQAYMPNYDSMVRARAMAINSERTKQEILAVVGQELIPIRNDRAVTKLVGDDALQRKFADENIGLINPNDPKHAEMMRLAAKAYAQENAKPVVNIQGERGDVGGTAIPEGAAAEAQRLASMAGITLTQDQIREALSEDLSMAQGTGGF